MEAEIIYFFHTSHTSVSTNGIDELYAPDYDSSTSGKTEFFKKETSV